jgi:dihydrofolate synthase / folylpolyglutamate synthase
MVSGKRINLDLDNMLSLLQVLGNPEKKLKNVIHVAGTNGKGSTCVFLSAILQAMGYSVNLYTSPHLVKFNERIKIYGADINDSQLIEYEEHCKDLWSNKDYTFFELATAMAFLAFNDHRADFNILEVGLGGTLDATNIVKNVILSIITSISMDHIEILGPDIESIASNKAGIIKHSTPVLLSQQKYHEAVKTIEVRAEAMQARLYQANRDWHIRPNRDKIFTYQDAFGWQLHNLKPPLAGSHQYDNLSTAIFATHILEINGKIKTTQTALISIANDPQKHNKTLVIFGSLYLAGQVLAQYNQ